MIGVICTLKKGLTYPVGQVNVNDPDVMKLSWAGRSTGKISLTAGGCKAAEGEGLFAFSTNVMLDSYIVDFPVCLHVHAFEDCEVIITSLTVERLPI